MIYIERERKWLFEGVVPEGLNVIDKCEILQGYISVDPEVRLRFKKKNDSELDFKMEIKGDGDLERAELPFKLTKEQFQRLMNIVGIKECQLIHKDFTSYEYGDNVIEVSEVDKDSTNSFKYIEVEFKTVEEAQEFQPLDWFGREVTYDKRYKMKNYWKTTRLSGDQQ